MTDNAPITFEKADLTVTPPGGGTIRFAIVEGKKGQPLPSPEKRKADDIHYDMYVEHPWVRAGIDKKAKVASTNGWSFKPEDPEGELDKAKAKELRAFFRRSGGKALLFQTFQDLGIYGRGFWYLEYKGGKPYKAKRLHPKFVDWFTDGREVTRFRYGPVSAETADQYEPIEILSFRVPDPNDDLMGLSPLRSLEKTVAIDLFAMDFNGSYFENNAQTGIVFKMKNATETEVIRNRAWLEEHYVGTKNAHRPLILEGDIEVEKSVASQQEMGFIEGRKFNREEILAVLDVDPDKVGVHDNSNRSTAKEGSNTFKGESIRPWQSLIEEPINNVLLPERFEWDDTLFAFNELDAQEEMANLDLINKAQGTGLLNADEGRARLGYGTVDGGDVHVYQTAAGLIPLALLMEQAKVALEKEKVGLRQAERLAAAPIPEFQGGSGGVEPKKPVKGQPGVNPNPSGVSADKDR